MLNIALLKFITFLSNYNLTIEKLNFLFQDHCQMMKEAHLPAAAWQ